MYFFDAKYLKQYLDMHKTVKVFVNGDVYTLTDGSDVSNKRTCVGYKSNGDVAMFDYQDITQIQVGVNILTLDTLQKIMSTKPTQSPNTSKSDANDGYKPPESISPDKPKKPSRINPGAKSPAPKPESDVPETSDDAEDSEETGPTDKKQLKKDHYDPYMIGKQLIKLDRQRWLTRK